MGSENLDQSESKKSFFFTFFTVFVLIVVLIGIFFVISKRDSLNQEAKISDETKQNLVGKEPENLLRLTTAPENNPNIKPNPELTALITATQITSQDDAPKVDVLGLTATD